MQHFHPAEILQCRHHAGRVGVVGIHYQIIVGSWGKLRAIVVWNIFFQCFWNIFFWYIEKTSDGDGGKGIFKVIRAYQVGAYLMSSVFVPPLESEEWGTYSCLAANIEFRFVFCAVGDTGQPFWNLIKMLIIPIDEMVCSPP